jgi:O-antigen/teichoic acid export membrane protein
MFLFAKYLSPEFNGLTRVLVDLGVLFAAVASFGAPTLLTKFHPYYKDRLAPKETDLLTIALLIGTAGLLLVAASTLFLKPFIVRKFSGKSPLFVDYYYLFLPITFCLTYFNILEAHAWNHFRTVISNFFKEVSFRIVNLLLICIYVLQWITFDTFIVLFSLQYAVSFIGLLIHMAIKGEIAVTFGFSTLTRRLWKKMIPYVMFILAGNIVLVFNSTFDGLAISSLQGLEFTAVFTLVNYLCTTIAAPQRSVVGLAFPVISRAWKEKNMAKLADVYTKSSINLLLISTFLFGVIWINFEDLIRFLQLPAIYGTGKMTLLLLAMAKITELGTGVNGQIIISSRKWKFEFYSNMLLLAAAIPINYLMIKEYGIIGAGAASLICMLVFNAIRSYYLWRNYRLQPFTIKTLYALALPTILILLTIWLINCSSPLLNMVLRTLFFSGIFVIATLLLNISEDAAGIFQTFRKRLSGIIHRK